jgi:hypothetical protein
MENKMEPSNKFSMAHLESILVSARKAGYQFSTLSRFVDDGCPKEGTFLLRLDLDFKPLTLKPFAELSRRLSIPFTVFVRVSGPYNLFWYPNYAVLREVADAGCEIGLHTNNVEWAIINNLDEYRVLEGELSTLRIHFNASGIASHRDINYMYNSLPWINANWHDLRSRLGIKYHAYEDRIEKCGIYVNEGLSPHLGWRNTTPNQAIQTGKNVYMLLHPHWWYTNHAFEAE